jgi:hypothetical protein
MVIFLVDRNKLTITLHRKENCPKLSQGRILDCGCSSSATPEEEARFCEKHIKIETVKELMEGRFWISILCDSCFR